VGTRNFVCVETENPIMSSLLPSKRPVCFLLKGERPNKQSAAIFRNESLNTFHKIIIFWPVMHDHEIVITAGDLAEESFQQTNFAANTNY
jgi:hypothetical protein